MSIRWPKGAKNKILVALVSFLTLIAGIVAKIEFIDDDEVPDPVEQPEAD